MELKTYTRQPLPELGFTVVQNWCDTQVVLYLLHEMATPVKTVGELIEARGIQQAYILGLCGRYPLLAIRKYIAALSDTHGQHYDAVLDTNPEFETFKG
jgi:hypothetical protein